MIRRTADEAALDESMKKQCESEDFEAFARCYEGLTGLTFRTIEESEQPDFICIRSDGKVVGVELTSIRRGPDDVFFESIYDGRFEIDAENALDELSRLLLQKAEKVRRYVPITACFSFRTSSRTLESLPTWHARFQ